MKRDLRQFAGKQYDLVVIGGGVSGGAIAWDASLRGLKVALIEKTDFGAGTSTATSKLIHGGLRYLKNLELNLVRESLRERRTLEELAPHLVYPLPFVIPVYGWAQFFVMFLGMFLYELLSFDKARLADRAKRVPSFSILSRKQMIARDPNLYTRGLTGAYQYYDCQSLSPDRLTLAFIQSAVAAGADVANYVQAEGLIRENGRVAGVTAVDKLDGGTVEIRGKTVVVAAGPWADIVLAKAMGHPPQTKIRRSKGIHVITPNRRGDFALTLQSRAAGHFFIIPWRNHTLIGTTDTDFVGTPDQCDVSAEDIARFLGLVNQAYGSAEKFKPENVVFAYAGLRPLVDRQTKNVYNVSRKHEIVDHGDEGFDGMFSVLGGKYTTSRELAEEMVNRVEAKLGRATPCTTKQARLAGGEIADLNAFLAKATAEGAFLGSAADMVARQYGTAYPQVLAIAKENPAWAKPVAGGDSVLAEVVHAFRNEMAATLDDALFRRTGIATLGNPGDDVLAAAAQIGQAELGWSPERTARELAKVRAKLDYPRLEQAATVA